MLVVLIEGTKLRFNSFLWLTVCWRDYKSHLLYRNVRLPRSRTVRYGCLPEGGCRICLWLECEEALLVHLPTYMGSTVFFKFWSDLVFYCYINTITAHLPTVISADWQCYRCNSMFAVIDPETCMWTCCKAKLFAVSSTHEFQTRKKKTENYLTVETTFKNQNQIWNWRYRPEVWNCCEISQEAMTNSWTTINPELTLTRVIEPFFSLDTPVKKNLTGTQQNGFLSSKPVNRSVIRANL